MAERAIDRDRMISRKNDKENKTHTHTNQEKKRQKVKKQNEENVRTTNSENGILSSIWRVLSILISYLYRMNCITLCYPQTYFPDQVCSAKTQHKTKIIFKICLPYEICLAVFYSFTFFISWIFIPFFCKIILKRLKFGIFLINLILFYIFPFLNLPKKIPWTSKINPCLFKSILILACSSFFYIFNWF